MTGRFDKVNSLVAEALDLPASDREAYVAARCGPDEGSLTDALRLLALSNSMDRFLESPPANLSEIRPGEVLGGRFRIVEELGSGGMGSIFLAEDRHLGRVAIKALHPEICHDSRAMERFLAEIAISRTIRHPNVCPVFDLFIFDRAHGGALVAFTMQYLSGETLARRILRGPIPAAGALPIARGIAAGMDAFHAAGIVHRDLKPDNIMLTAAGDGSVAPVIMDFGLASRPVTSVLLPGSDTAACGISGSPDYMAPEQFRGAPAARSADIYAFGLILFEMIAGVRPFPPEELLPAVIRRTTEEAPRLRTVASDAPFIWDRVIARALARDASQRPASANALLDEIERELAGQIAPTFRTGAHCRHPFPLVAVRRGRPYRRAR